MTENTIEWRGKTWDLSYVPEKLDSHHFTDLYEQKNRRGVRELIQKYRITYYEVFTRFIIDTNDKKYIKWFLTSAPGIYKDIIKDTLFFHNYRILHEFNKHKIGLKPFLFLMGDDRTATSIVNGTVPYEKLNV